MPSIGQLNRRITFKQHSASTDSYGEHSGALVDVLSTWANVKPMSGRELYEFSQMWEESLLRITIRYRANITSDMKVQYGSRLLEIVSIINTNEERRFLELVCKDVT